MWRYGKRKLSITIIVMMIMAMLPTMALAASPSDISNHWAKAYIEDWIDRGLVNGYPDGTFKPDNKITRAEFMVLVNGAFGYTEKASKDYNDVAAADWYADAVAIATNAGYITGYADGTVKPNNQISRQEVAVVIMKVNNLTQNESAADKFADAGNIAAWSKGAIGAAVAGGIMNGYPDGSFKAANFMSKAEAVVALSKALGSVTGVTPITPVDGSEIYDKAGTYGPASGTQTVEGNVTIKVAGVTLQNTVIKGDLIIDKGVGKGEATFKNVIVKGNTYIKGGGVNSIYFIDSETGKTYVLKDDGPVRIVVSGTSEINQLIAQSGVVVEEVDLTGDGIEGIIVDKKIDGNIEINLVNVNVENLTIKSEGITVNTDKNTSINTFVADAKASVTGKGTIENAIINASGVSLETKPENQTVATGVSQPSITGTSSGGGGSSSAVAVSAISVSGEGDATTITTNNGSLQMLAAIEPANATNKNVTWSVTDGTGEAAISSAGLLTAVKNGTVTVKATAKDGSGKSGAKEIVISGQIPVISTASTIANGAVNPTVVVTLTKDAFTADANLPANWTGSVGTTNLTGGATTRNSDTQITFQLNGTAQAGTLTLQANAAALTSGVASNTITITVPEAPVTISQIKNAVLDMRKGSIIMGYTFENDNDDVITYADAISDAYALDEEASTVTLLKSGASIGNTVKLSQISIGNSDKIGESGKVIFTDFEALLAAFGLDFSNPANIPDEVKVIVNSKTTVAGKTVDNPWGPIEFSEPVTSDLYLDSGIDPGKSSASIAPGNKTAGQPFPVTIILKDADDAYLPNGNYGVQILNGDAPIGGGAEIAFTNGQASVDALLASAGSHTLTVKVNNTTIGTVSVTAVPSPILGAIFTTMDGTEIHLTFDKAMADPTGKHGQFTVTVNGNGNSVTKAALKTEDSSTIVLTLTTLLVGSENITIAYTQGDVVAADNGILCTFAPAPVTNNAPELYTVTFAAGTSNNDLADITGATNYVATATATEGVAYTAPVLSQEGYAFNGWFTDAACTAAYVPAADAITANITLYAKFTADAPAALGGTVSITGTLKFGEVLTADTTLLTGNTGTLSYQWKRGATEIGADSSTYTVVADDIGATISVEVTSSVETGTITGTAGSAIAKADGPAEITEGFAGTFPAEATSINLTGLAESATGLEAAVAINGTEYAAYVDLTVDVSGNASITGLTSVTTSTKVKVRVKETATHLAGADKEITVTAE